MEECNLPTEIAEEPAEEARLSQGDEINSPSMALSTKQRQGIIFAEATQSSENYSQSSTRSYKDFVSQPAPGLSHRQRLLWLQKRRTPGLWVQCDDCDRWRFLPDVVDAHELPARWICKMNQDKSAADCSVPEAPLRLHEEEDLIHGEYSAGSLVWVRLAGWPWWPAMVDDCVDTEQYYWLDGFSDIPTHYNVVFFDSLDATRAWVSTENLKPYTPNKKMMQKDKKYRKRLETAISQANDAEKLPLGKRLAKYSFIARYPGSINQPKAVSRQELERFQRKLKRIYDIDFPDENEDEDPIITETTTTVIKKGENVLLVGTPKSKKNKIRKTNIMNNNTEEITKIELLKDARSQETVANTEVEENHYNEPIFKQPDSLVAHVGSNVTSTVVDLNYDNDTSTTYVPGSESENQTTTIHETLANVQKRAASPSSDDFEF